MNGWYILGLEGSDWREKLLFFTTIGFVCSLASVGIINPDLLANTMNGAFDFVIHRFGWWFMLLGFLLSAIMVFFAFSRYGNVRIGGPDAKPEFDTFSWFSMVFTVGFAASVIFWGVAEPALIFNNPPKPMPVEGSTKSIALAFMFLHDILPGLVAWFMPLAVAFGIILYTRGAESYKISSMLEPVLDRERYAVVYWVTDLAALIAIVGGLATSLGLTGQQLSKIISSVYGIETGVITYGLFVLIGVLFLVDVWLGLRSGIRNMARATVVLVTILFSILLVVGPTFYIFNISLDAAGIWIGSLPRLMLYTGGTANSTWAYEWTSFWWAWFAAWGIFVGSFVARVSKGRTIRETFIILGIAPAFFLFIQHGILGGWTLAPGNVDAITTALTENGEPAALAEAINITPMSPLIGLLFMLVLTGYVITSLDSAVFMLSSINIGDEDPNARNRAWWGVVLAALGLMTLELPGTRPLESFSAVLALPFTVFFLVILYATYVTIRDHYHDVYGSDRDSLFTRHEADSETPDESSSTSYADD
ncbi:BCCT family transporter [Natrinema sp. 74]|uniref:BCCT family transporter n=1 Tax=Natrinema sp. 74 TaxID=3384159 RepID=UPI0038D3C59D